MATERQLIDPRRADDVLDGWFCYPVWDDGWRTEPDVDGWVGDDSLFKSNHSDSD
ncbi:hypothetical protein [Aeromonas salmonicida]|uniref:hypothetical protein n=1 Tax=Aeromonas salmonicida TaxID=645 RepID=UPI0031FC4290